MPRTVVTLNTPKFKLADTQAGLTAGTAYECQLTQAVITASPNFQTVPATGCAPASQSPGATSWALDMAWLQDWTAPSGGLSGYALTNDAKPKWFELTLDVVGSPTTKATGQCYVVAGSFGGTFGDGTAANTTATWPLLDKPVVTTPALMMVEGMEAEGQTAEEPQPQPA